MLQDFLIMEKNQQPEFEKGKNILQLVFLD